MDEIRLIVNGDDYGSTAGVNKGIAEAAEYGILTSTTVMINHPRAGEISDFKKKFPGIGTGVHLEFPGEMVKRWLTGKTIGEGEVLEIMEEQIQKFKKTAGEIPDHIDFHKVVVKSSGTYIAKDTGVFEKAVEKLSEKYNLPWRGMDGVEILETFHGAIYNEVTYKKSESVPERVSAESLSGILRNLKPGIYDMITHPGYVDSEMTSSYNIERETEVKTLTSPEIAKVIKETGIKLINYGDIKSP